MSEILTWQERITTKSSDDDILDYKQNEINELRAALADRDAKLAALEKPNAFNRKLTAQLEQEWCVLRSLKDSYSAAGAAPVPEGWRSAVAMAYGHLWHINNEPMAPIPLRSEESASYAARKLLRDLLTTEERGEAINSVRAMLSSAPKDAP